jgi:hypothetical protein
MEPPAGARLERGVWSYRPVVPAQAEVLLAHSPYAAGYELCIDGRCAPLAAWLPDLPTAATVRLAACP